jgi:replicative DNA helicase
MNRTKNDDGEKDTTQIGLSDRIGQDATCVIMLDRERMYEDKDKTKIKDDRLIMDITKSRDGGTGKLIYHANFNTGKFNILNPDAPTDASRYETFDAEPVAGKNGEIQF